MNKNIKTFLKIDHCLVYITEKCNLRCDYCFVQARVREPKSISKSIMIKTINFLLGPISGKNINISFFGGEPLMEFKKLKIFVNYVKKLAKSKNKKITFSLVTNGTLLNHKRIKFLEKEGVKIILSCDGNKYSQNRHRVFLSGSGTFNILDKKINDISKIKDSIARITFTKYTIDKIYDNMLYLYNNGFKTIGCSPVDQKSWTRKEILILKNQLVKMGKFWLDKKTTDGDFTIKPLIDYIRIAKNPRQKFPIHMHNCWAGSEGLSINIDGKIYPCHRFIGIKKFCIGNVFNKKLDEKIRSYFLDKPIDKIGCMGINYKFCRDPKKAPFGPLQIKRSFIEVATAITRGFNNK